MKSLILTLGLFFTLLSNCFSYTVVVSSMNEILTICYCDPDLTTYPLESLIKELNITSFPSSEEIREKRIRYDSDSNAIVQKSQEEITLIDSSIQFKKDIQEREELKRKLLVAEDGATNSTSTRIKEYYSSQKLEIEKQIQGIDSKY